MMFFEAYTMADTIVVYSNGRVIQCGPPSEVFNNPANNEVEALVSTKKLAVVP